MEPEFSEIDVLVDLGLTLVQAKVYWALAKSGSLKTSAISKISKVAQPDVYRSLSKLQELGLVQRVIKKPLEYMATPANQAISLLLETKTEQFKKVRADAKLIVDRIEEERPKRKNQLEVPQFVLIPKGRTVIERINTSIVQAQLSMDLLLSWKRFSRGIVDTFAESMENAWDKKVKIRFIVEKPSESETAKQLIRFCEEKPFCQMKFIPNRPEIVLGIYDENEVFVIANPETDLPGSSALWSSNRSIIALAKSHFEVLWLNAMEQPEVF